MPKLTIDNIEVDVPPGTNVLEAARRVGIVIPHFCYHEALGAVGACRLCAMKFTEGPVKGIQMSCMIPAQDGMVVSTADPETVRLRQLVIEWLMINHPHDCPVCDEGGECLLQDYTVAGGHAIRRYKGNKRTFLNQYLGPYIEHEMNRCIECYRCVRFYQEYAGGTDLGTMGSAARVYFGRFADGELESPFSGNLLDICPTGVYTDRTARYRARHWDYDMAPSVCPHCSVGCNTTPAARYRELLKTTARRNDLVNGFFICDRGRFGNAAVNDPARPRMPLVGGKETGWEAALDTLCCRMRELAATGAGSVAVVGSSRLPHEAAVLLPRLAAALGATLCSFTGSDTERVIEAVAVSDPARTASMADVARADAVVLVQCDLLEEAPMLALAVRQAWRRGAALYAVGPGAGPLAAKLSLPVKNLGALTDVPLASCAAPVVICGVHAGIRDLREAAATGARLAFPLTGPNACGAALVAQEQGALPLERVLATGRLAGLLAFEADLPEEVAAAVPFLATADWQDTTAVRRAQVVLPTTAWVEMDGTFINYERRAQRFRKVMNPGRPIRGLDTELHPPRVFRTVPPGGEPRPAWEIIATILARLGEAPVDHPFSGRWERLRTLDPEGPGERI